MSIQILFDDPFATMHLSSVSQQILIKSLHKPRQYLADWDVVIAFLDTQLATEAVNYLPFRVTNIMRHASPWDDVALKLLCHWEV